MKNGKEFKVIGMMSGTSLDGLDLAYCSFRYENDHWKWEILAAETVDYPADWLQRLGAAMKLTGEELSRLHIDLGNYFGECAVAFIRKYNCNPDLIGSHGHTVFHQPERRMTCQIGSGAEIFAASGIQVVCDFRTLDMAFGGQGAPLVPVGDRLLFSRYDACLNLGGIANISYEIDRGRIAYDICPCNMTLNRLASREGLAYDDEGKMAASGNLINSLLEKMNSLEYYRTAPPKSLGQEYIDGEFIPHLKGYSTADLLRTSVEHTAGQVADSIRMIDKSGIRVLATGGGALNNFLIGRINDKLQGVGEIVIPDPQVISYKEALVFALLAVLKVNGQVNVLSSVTGADRDTSSGIIIG